MTSKVVRKNVSQFDYCFKNDLRSNRANTVMSRLRTLKYDEQSLQVFCAAKRRMIVSREYFLAKDSAFNREIVSADIGNDILMVTLNNRSQNEQCTKFVSMANNQDLGDLQSDDIFVRVIEVEDLPKKTQTEVTLAVIDGRNQVSLLVNYSDPRGLTTAR
jgi:hypothetical protein